MKHIETQDLWLQSKVRAQQLTVKKIPRDDNFGDDLTHHWQGTAAERRFAKTGGQYGSIPPFAFLYARICSIDISW